MKPPRLAVGKALKRVRGTMQYMQKGVFRSCLVFIVAYLIGPKASRELFGQPLSVALLCLIGVSFAVAVVIGLIRPLITTRLRGALVGFALAGAGTVPVLMVFRSSLATLPVLLLSALWDGLLLGAPIGWMAWRPPSEE